MAHYDIVFVGYVAAGNIVPYNGVPFVLEGSAVLFGTMAVFCVRKSKPPAPSEELLKMFMQG